MLRAPAGERSGGGGGAAGAPDGAGGGETRHPPAQSCPTRLGRTPPPGCLGTIPGIQGEAVRAGTGGYVRHRLFPITIATEDWSRCGSRSVLLQVFACFRWLDTKKAAQETLQHNGKMWCLCGVTMYLPIPLILGLPGDLLQPIG
ncbi:uncharacterized protein LOC130540499 isoform X3 [Pan paniscus]|uniref:uncharacterized protein LOC130540499 isoform X3 n=1 Tax=Pan paniscus TaxID=9597 RepID=UPI00156162E8|nr:uncharacterized protein LOC130540499 isoform X3 [Pan paniscus]XP_057154749.1 uncharacterized protein LOC130540499 isoform X3 [Pan paniscus]XP_057154750.1 uncharacterized protein LOC130540499 isoform X3 [Pan paniscus]